MYKWESEKETLTDLIINQKVSYEEIGRRYECSGANIKKVAKKLGIEIVSRRKINSCETFGKDSGVKRFCLNCGEDISHKYANIYCDHTCQFEYAQKQYIQNWKDGKESGVKGDSDISSYVRKYLFDKYDNKCQKCNWNEINPFSGYIPLNIHHIDGDAKNNSEENLELLCPNCHSLTDNFGSLNKNATRIQK